MDLCNGVLVVWKPAGISSKDVSRLVESELGKIRMGHAGTLDPMAEGILPLLVGKATRLQSYFVDCPKSYTFDLEFGYETDTLDREGKEVARAPYSFTEASLREAVSSLQGEIRQTPPAYSSVKVAGRPLYYYMRTGRELPVPLESLARNVHVHGFDIDSFDGSMLTASVRCGKGTYVRSLGAELAKKLGTLATVTRIVRTSAGNFDRADAHSVSDIIECCRSRKSLRPLLIPLEEAKLPLPKVLIPDVVRISNLRKGQTAHLNDDEFAGSLASSHLKNEALLLSHEGRAFGLGCVWKQTSRGFNVEMKRSLV